MNTPTPETDAVWEKGENILDHARKLERERDEAKQQLASYTCKAILTNGGTLVCSPPVGIAYNALRDERDQLRKVADELSESARHIGSPFFAEEGQVLVAADKALTSYKRLPHVIAKTCKVCGQATEMPFHTCSGERRRAE